MVLAKVMSRTPVERALEAARVSHSIQREQCIVIRHMPKGERHPDLVADHEQEIADLRATVKHLHRRGYER